jgi:hypothetical protein
MLEREYLWTLLWAIEREPFIRGLSFEDKDSDASKIKEIDFRVILSQDLTGSDHATQAENPRDERQNNKQTTASRNGPGSTRYATYSGANSKPSCKQRQNGPVLAQLQDKLVAPFLSQVPSRDKIAQS